MLKSRFFLVLLSLLMISTGTIAQTEPYLNFNSFINANADDLPNNEELDIAYHYMVPQYEENPDPDKQIVLEYYFSEYDGSDHSKKKIEFIKQLFKDDQFENPNLNLEVIAVAPHGYDIEASKDIKDIGKLVGQSNIHYENMSEGIYFEIPDSEKETTYHKNKLQKQNKRVPANAGNKIANIIKNPRNYWTFIRGASSTGAVFASLYVAQGISPGIAAAVGLMPGLASGGITYFSGHYGNFLTNGKWTNWVLTSESLVAKGLRTGMGMTPKRFINAFVENDAQRKKLYAADPQFRKDIDELYKTDPKAFKEKLYKEIADGAKPNRFAKATSIFRHMDEYIKWWVTEVAFTTFAIKIPQAVAGIGASMSMMDSIGHVLMGSTMGMAAQGPADIAIQLRKFQKIEELRDAIKAGKIENVVSEIDDVVDGKVVGKKSLSLLDEVEMVLAKTGPHKGYSIHSGSHKALQKIENWARSRATMLSFFSVAGVGMEIAHIPLARPLLLGIGIFGGTYYAHVRGWIKPKIPAPLKKFFEPFKLDNIKKLGMKSLLARFCSNKFRVKP